MFIKSAHIENFRLLKKVKLNFSEQTTVIVGRNNSGKTSLTEFFRRILAEDNWDGALKSKPKFELQDFSACTHSKFKDAYVAFSGNDNPDLAAVRSIVPSIEACLTIDYSDNVNNYGALSDFIIDLDPSSTEAVVVVRYELGGNGVSSLFEDIEDPENDFFKILQERIPALYEINVYATDPNDQSNQKQIDLKGLRVLLRAGFISAQRGLGDGSEKGSGLLSKSIERLFTSSLSDDGLETDRVIAKALERAVKSLEGEIDAQFASFITQVITPQFQPFGYPSLQDIPLKTETSFDVQGILKSFCRIGYAASGGVNLPESYNGLGTRNLIYILLKLFEFMKCYATSECLAGVQLIFIEEPEAHLHPQMQEVFIKNLNSTIEAFSVKFNKGASWPVQFVVTTHSSHLANSADFDSMRYFSANACDENDATNRETFIKDVSVGLHKVSKKRKEFLHKYMTLTKCDLFFADKAILVEGISERLLIPKMILKRDGDVQGGRGTIGSDYLSIVEVGGAYAYIFFPLVEFLGLPTLVITDLDSTKPSVSKDGKTKWKKCRVSEGEWISNVTIKLWFKSRGEQKPQSLMLASDDKKVINNVLRIAYQVPEIPGSIVPCGRSFEDAFMLANPGLFGLDGVKDIEGEAYDQAATKRNDKSDFALKYAIEQTEWTIPRYIKDGLDWIADAHYSCSPSDDLPCGEE